MTERESSVPEASTTPEKRSLRDAIRESASSGDLESFKARLDEAFSMMDSGLEDSAEGYELTCLAVDLGKKALGHEAMWNLFEDRYGDPRPEHRGEIADSIVGKLP